MEQDPGHKAPSRRKRPRQDCEEQGSDSGVGVGAGREEGVQGKETADVVLRVQEGARGPTRWECGDRKGVPEPGWG